MNFKKLTKDNIANSFSYIVAVTILNMTGEFTINEIHEKLKSDVTASKMNQDELMLYIHNKLKTLMNNGSIIQRDGIWYSCR